LDAAVRGVNRIYEVKVMRKLLFLLVGTAVLCAAAVSVASASVPTPAKLAAQTCRSIRSSDGQKLFRQTYHSFAGCLSNQQSQAPQDISNAAKTCKSQRSDPNFAATHDGKSFNQFYGANGGNGKGAGANAFGKCVSAIAKQNAKDDVQDSVAGAKTCKALKQSDLSTFQATYGTGRNAFGKCVSKQSSAKNG
jgi:hypothetical protein